MNSAPGNHSVNRLIEWFFAAAILGQALVTFLTYGQPQQGAFAILANSGFGDAWIVTVFGVVGIERMIALYANGRWKPYGAWMRLAGSLCGALIWSVLSLALLTIFLSGGPFYRAAIITYSIATVFELLSVHRAANDSRIGAF